MKFSKSPINCEVWGNKIEMSSYTNLSGTAPSDATSEFDKMGGTVHSQSPRVSCLAWTIKLSQDLPSDWLSDIGQHWLSFIQTGARLEQSGPLWLVNQHCTVLWLVNQHCTVPWLVGIIRHSSMQPKPKTWSPTLCGPVWTEEEWNILHLYGQ